MNARTFRVIVGGSSTWPYPAVVVDRIHDATAAFHAHHPGLHGRVIIIHDGSATGPGAQAARELIKPHWRRPRPWAEEVHAPDWATGRGAAYRGHKVMVAHGAHCALTFICDQDPEPLHLAQLAEEAGIPTFRYTPTGATL